MRAAAAASLVLVACAGAGSAGPGPATFCEAVSELEQRPSPFAGADPAESRRLADEAVEILDEMLLTAPGELTEPVGRIDATYRHALLILEEYGYDTDSAGFEEGVLRISDLVFNPESVDAAQALDAWRATNC